MCVLVSRRLFESQTVTLICSRAMELSDQEMAAMSTIDAIADWCDLPHRTPSAASPASPRGTFFEARGASPTTRPRIFAAISEDMFKQVVDGWQIEGARPSPVLVASAGLIGTVASCMALSPRQRNVPRPRSSKS